MISRLSLIGGALIGGFVVFLGFGAVNSLWLLPRATEQGRALERAAATAEAINRIQELEKNNEAFRSLSSRDRCLALMRDSGLPDAGCD